MMNDMRDLRSRQAALASEVRHCVPAAWWGPDGGAKTQLGDRFKLSQVCLPTERQTICLSDFGGSSSLPGLDAKICHEV